jgi:HEAT repeat protein
VPSKAFDRKLQALEAVRSMSDDATVRDQLRQALGDRNNYLVARAAAITADLRHEDLLPELLDAFDRFFVEPAKSDPRCLAKAALARALRSLSYHVSTPYERGIVHFQFEPAWGGRADTAAALRGTCALALSECPLDDLYILTYLADALADPDKLVRINSAIAIDQLSRPEGALLLRLKALSRDESPDVIGQCLTSLLSLAPPGAVAFVGQFLRSSNPDVQLEAVSALAQARDAGAVEALIEFWREPLLALELQRALLVSLGASPLREAAEFLLSVVADGPPALSETACTALTSSRFHPEFAQRLQSAMRRNTQPDFRPD